MEPNTSPPVGNWGLLLKHVSFEPKCGRGFVIQHNWEQEMTIGFHLQLHHLLC